MQCKGNTLLIVNGHDLRIVAGIHASAINRIVQKLRVRLATNIQIIKLF